MEKPTQDLPKGAADNGGDEVHFEEIGAGEKHHQMVHGLVEDTKLFQSDSSGRTSKTYLLPRPTVDPRDPLLWPTWKKHAAFASVCYMVFLANFQNAAIGPVVPYLVKDLGVSVTKVSWLISFNVLFLGLGNLFWVPVSRKIGKRPVIVMCSIINFAGIIWSAKSKSWGSMLASRIVQGFAAGSSECLAPTVGSDLYFLHQRGMAMGFFSLAIALGSALGGIFGGLVANARAPDWTWNYWLGAMLTGVCALSTILFQAETNFVRAADCEDGEGLDSIELPAIRASVKSSSWLQSLKFTAWYDRENSIWWLLSRPWQMAYYPAVIFVALTHGVLLGGVVVQITANSALFPAIYNFSPLAVGNTSVASVIGSFTGSYLGGPATDWIPAMITKRRNGYFKPEYRLWCLLPAYILAPVGLMMWGAGFGQKLSPYVPIVGTGIFYHVLCAGAATSIVYIVDCYRPMTGEVVTCLIGFRNSLAFAITFAIFPWIELDGPTAVGGYLTLITTVVFLLTIPMYIYGPKARAWTSTKAL